MFVGCVCARVIDRLVIDQPAVLKVRDIEKDETYNRMLEAAHVAEREHILERTQAAIDAQAEMIDPVKVPPIPSNPL
eukprot:1182735-Prorocentrum_minimum.AAC.1